MIWHALASLLLVASTAVWADQVIPGAIRWDAIHAPLDSSPNRSITRTLSPAQWHYRAPWFATVNPDGTLTIAGNRQEIMDQEITYAHDAGLKYWAYLWYRGSAPTLTDHVMLNGWHLHQQSSKRNDMNWIQMQQIGNLRGAADFEAQFDQIIGFFKQDNYQKVLGGRPVWMLYGNGSEVPQELTKYWGGSWTALGTSIRHFRDAVNRAGLNSPYIVLVYAAAANASAADIDAISSYIPNFGPEGKAVPWASTDMAIRAYWDELKRRAAKAGVGMVPIGANGWDMRPRQEHCVDWDKTCREKKPREFQYHVAPTPHELTVSLQAEANFVTANPALAQSRLALIYAWDECDEGACLMPTLGTAKPGEPDLSRLDALRSVHW